MKNDLKKRLDKLDFLTKRTFQRAELQNINILDMKELYKFFDVFFKNFYIVNLCFGEIKNILSE